jgi:hypothetical protein
LLHGTTKLARRNGTDDGFRVTQGLLN